MRDLNWKQILVTAGVTGAVTILTGMALFFLQRREPKLEYYADETIPFESADQNNAIYHVTVTNRGARALEDVVAEVAVTNGNIEKPHVRPSPGLTFIDSVVANVYRVRFPLMNPGENATLSVLATGRQPLPAKPQVVVRAKGLTGNPGEREQPFNLGFVKSTGWPALAAAYAGVFAALLLRRGRRRLFGGSQRDDLAFLCSVFGLSADADRHFNAHSDTSYWMEAERLGALSVSDPNSPDSIKRQQLLEALLDYAEMIAGPSVGIIHYNLARITAAKGDRQLATEHLAKARKGLGAKAVEKRVRLDPVLRDTV